MLTVLSQRSAHGFALAQVTAPDGELGRIWQIPKAVVYRAIGRLLEAGLIVAEGVEPGQGPRRTVYAASPEGREQSREWLRAPVEHVREIRSALLLKLALLDRAGEDPGELLRRQRVVLEPIAEALAERQADCDGFDAVLVAWRQSTVQAALSFLDAVTPAVALDDQPLPEPGT